MKKKKSINHTTDKQNKTIFVSNKMDMFVGKREGEREKRKNRSVCQSSQSGERVALKLKFNSIESCIEEYLFFFSFNHHIGLEFPQGCGGWGGGQTKDRKRKRACFIFTTVEVDQSTIQKYKMKRKGKQKRKKGK